jgi:hypothetical protein
MSPQDHPALTIFHVGSFDTGMGGRMSRKCIYSRHCDSCGANYSGYSYENATLEISGGTSPVWADLVSATIVSERVVAAMTADKITGFKAHPVEITKVTRKKLLAQTMPQYFLLEPTGSVCVDEASFAAQGYSLCPECANHLKSPEANWEFHLLPDLKTWDGSDFIRVRNMSAGMTWTFCSRRFIDLAGKNRWRGFCFGQMMPGLGMTHDPGRPAESLDYVRPNWLEMYSARLQAKYPEIFGLPPNPVLPKPAPKQSPPPPVLTPEQRLAKAEGELLEPRFDLLEAHFKCDMPKSLRALYGDKEELLRTSFLIEHLLPEHLREYAEEEEDELIRVDHYCPITGETMLSWGGPNLKHFVEFASDGSAGIYCVDPREADPEVHVYCTDGDLDSLEVTLSEFLAAPRRNRT